MGIKVEPNHRAGVKLALRNSVQQSGHSRDDGGGDDRWCWDGEGDGDAVCARAEGEDGRQCGDNTVDGYFMVLTLMVMRRMLVVVVVVVVEQWGW